MPPTAASASAIDRRRAGALIAVALLHGLIAWILLAGLQVTLARRLEPVLRVFDLPPPAAAPQPVARAAPRPAAAAAPANRRARARAVVAPVPEVPLIVPPPDFTAIVAGAGPDANAGAAPIIGPGSGAGGEGAGSGAGGGGDGDGGGTPLQLIRGRIKDSDYPDAALAAGIGGTVRIRYIVGVDGRPHDCRVLDSSGNADLDAATCRLIEARLYYRPERDAAGRPVAMVVTGSQTWEIGSRRRRDLGWQPPPQ